MTQIVCPSTALRAALSGTGNATLHLSPAATKVRDRFKDLVGFKRNIIHELGHAVVAAYLDHPLVSVTIEPDGDLGGACRYAINQQDIGCNTFSAQRAVIASAGRVAVVTALDGHALTETEFACSIDSDHQEYAHDDRILTSLAHHLNVRYNPWVIKVSEEAWDILSLPHVWCSLMKLARELKRECTLTGDRVRQVLGGGMVVVG